MFTSGQNMKIFKREDLALRLVSLASIAVLIGLDRLTKWLITENMDLNQSINLIKAGDTEVLNLTYVLNNGAAFSILQGQRLILILLPSVFLVGALVFLLSDRLKAKYMLRSLTLVIAGGAGNLIDRIFNGGAVIDFIDFRIINFAIFNFADICAVTGALMLVFFMLKEDIKAAKKKKAAGRDALSAPVEKNE
jgi:signal peptidase II